MFNIPYGEEIFDGNTEQPINWGYNANATKDAKRGYVGYIFGLPRVSNTTNTILCARSKSIK
jgi:hypothetical protein